MFRSLIAFTVVFLYSGTSSAATFSFDGFIERETMNSNDDHHTLDFFRINIPSQNLLTIVGTEGTLPDLSINLYLQGGQGTLELSGLSTTRISDTVLKIEGTPAAGNYVLAVLPASATDWDRFEGLKSNFGVSGQDPPLGLGSYHIDITGDFAVTEILEGQLSIPEPSAWALGSCAFACLLASLGKRRFGSRSCEASRSGRPPELEDGKGGGRRFVVCIRATLLLPLFTGKPSFD